MNDSKITFCINLITSVMFISGFLIFFFFTYVERIEKMVTIKQTEDITNYFSENIFKFLSETNKEKLIEYLNNTSKQKSYIELEKDEKIKKKNKILIRNTIISMSIGFIILSTVVVRLVLLIKKNKMMVIQDVIKKNVVILIIIALTEFLYVKLVIQNYISFDTNFIIYKTTSILDDFKNSFVTETPLEQS